MDQLSVLHWALRGGAQSGWRLLGRSQSWRLISAGHVDVAEIAGRPHLTSAHIANKWRALLNIALTSSDWLWPALGHDTAGPGLFIKNNDDIRFRFGTNHGPASPSRWWQDLGASSLRLWRDEGKGGRKNENMRGIPVVSAQTLLVKLKCFQVGISRFCFTAWKLGAVCSDLPGWSLNWRSSRFKGFNFGDQKQSSLI